MLARTGPDRDGPVVSVLMANYNGADYIADSLASALGQTLRDIEVIVVDDASTDGSAAIAKALAATDPRVRVLLSAGNAGPAAARNMALDAARGRWIAVQDSDDLMHPERLERLVAMAERDGADIAADDLLEFGREHQSNKLLVGAVSPRWLPPARFVRDASRYGYLKPIWRARLTASLRYNARMIVAEDFDFICRMLLSGARYRFYPEATYFYRKHASSISSLSTNRKQQSILAGDQALRRDHAPRGALLAALNARRRAILRQIAFELARDAIFRRDLLAAARALARRPTTLVNFTAPLRKRLASLWRPVRADAPDECQRAAIVIVSRHRLDAPGRVVAPRLAQLLAAADGRFERRLLVLPAPGIRVPAPAAAPGLFDTVLVADAAHPGLAHEDPAQALFIAIHTPDDARLVVADGAKLASHLAFRIHPGIGSLVVAKSEPPLAPGPLARLLDLPDPSAGSTSVVETVP